MHLIQKLIAKIATPCKTEALLSLGLFLLAFMPRAYALDRFVTADEAKWVYRSAQFLAAFLQGDWAGTTVNLTPAVTTTWLGSLGLSIYYQLHQATLGIPLEMWLRSLPEFRADLEVLVALRWPMVGLTALGVVLFYRVTRRLFGTPLALIAAIFIALDPHLVALSRVLGHDSPVTLFMGLSVLWLLLAMGQSQPPPSPPRFRGGGNQSTRSEHPQMRRGASLSSNMPGVLTSSLILSAITAGLAFLSKAPSLFLLPFVGLIFLTNIWLERDQTVVWLKRLGLWTIVAYLTFIIVWPAAWVDPIGRPWAVAENAFLSATDSQEANAEGFWLVPDLGPFYYPVNGGFKLSPLVTIGTLLALVLAIKQIKSSTNSPPTRSPISQSPNLPISLSKATLQSPLFWLTLFILGFTLFMTFGGKRSPRYIAPIFPPLAIIAAWGWLGVYRWLTTHFKLNVLTNRWGQFAFSSILLLTALFTMIPYAPYYLTYFNPLLGGSATAPRLMKIGWGEGLDQVGRFLQRELPNSRVGTAYSSTISPFFQGDLAGLDSDRLDYVVIYHKQMQAGNAPLLPAVVRYYEHLDPVFSVELNGIRYADVYPGPAAQVAVGEDSSRQNYIPIGYRPLTPFGRIGEALSVDVIWQGAGPVSSTPVELALLAQDGSSIYAANGAELIQQTVDLVVSQHQLTIPSDLSRGVYHLRLNNQILGEIELRNFQPPSDLAQIDLDFEDQLALRAFQFEPTEDYIGVTLAWQAKQTHLPNYTVFVQLLNAENDERLAGIDTQPEQGTWPTSQWVAGEVVVDRNLVAVPPGLPPGYYKIIIGLYHSETGQRLHLFNGDDHWTLPWTLIREE
jgi:4-amino-4-deoxy-L-arabinose transferase-like glycosyltransferase